jgi:hypothetical protein
VAVRTTLSPHIPQYGPYEGAIVPVLPTSDAGHDAPCYWPRSRATSVLHLVLDDGLDKY